MNIELGFTGSLRIKRNGNRGEKGVRRRKWESFKEEEKERGDERKFRKESLRSIGRYALKFHERGRRERGGGRGSSVRKVH